MATANVTVTIEGLEALQALVERLERASEQIDAIGRPLYSDVHINTQADASE